MDTLLEAIGIVLETHFGFGFPNGSPIGDSLKKPHDFWFCFSSIQIIFLFLILM